MRAMPDDVDYRRPIEIARDALDAETKVADSLATRATTIVGFTGVVLTLALTIEAEIVNRELGSVGNPLSGACFGLSVLFLVAAALLALRAVPSTARRLSDEQVRKLRGGTQRDRELAERFIDGYVALTQETSRCGKHLQAALTCLFAGIVFVAGEAIIFVIDRPGL